MRLLTALASLLFICANALDDIAALDMDSFERDLWDWLDIDIPEDLALHFYTAPELEPPVAHDSAPAAIPVELEPTLVIVQAVSPAAAPLPSSVEEPTKPVAENQAEPPCPSDMQFCGSHCRHSKPTRAYYHLCRPIKHPLRLPTRFRADRSHGMWAMYRPVAIQGNPSVSETGRLNAIATTSTPTSASVFELPVKVLGRRKKL